MKTGMLMCCLAAAGLGGCTSTHMLLGESPEVVSESINTLQGKRVDLALESGIVHKDVRVTLFADSVVYQTEASVESGVVPLSSVATITRSGSAVGPVMGLVGGALLGGIIGTRLAVEDQISATRRTTVEPAGNGRTIPAAGAAGGAIGGLIGGVLGMALGGVLGSGDSYVFDAGPASGVPGGMGKMCIAGAVTASGDTVHIGVAGLLEVTPTTVMVRWNGETVNLQKPHAQVIRKGGTVLVIAPEESWQ